VRLWFNFCQARAGFSYFERNAAFFRRSPWSAVARRVTVAALLVFLVFEKLSPNLLSSAVRPNSGCVFYHSFFPFSEKSGLAIL